MNLNRRSETLSAPSSATASASTGLMNTLVRTLDKLIHPLVLPLHLSEPDQTQTHPSLILNLTQEFDLPILLNQYCHQQTSKPNLSQQSILSPHHPELSPQRLGYHIFIQVSTQSQLSEVIINWQRLRSRLNNSTHTSSNTHHNPHNFSNLHNQSDEHDYLLLQQNNHPGPGTVVPLLYQTHDVNSRLLAVSTINAYARENAIDTFSLINIITPHQIRKSFNPSASLTPTSAGFQFAFSPFHNTQSYNSNSNSNSNSNHPYHQQQQQHHHSSPDSSRPLAGLASPPISGDLSGTLSIPSSPTTTRTFQTNLNATNQLNNGSSLDLQNEFYNQNPPIIPLIINSEIYISDAMNEILISPLLIVQDLLPILKTHRGRVVNVWDEGQVKFKKRSVLERMFLPDVSAYSTTTEGLMGIISDGFEKICKTLSDELMLNKKKEKQQTVNRLQSTSSQSSSLDILNYRYKDKDKKSFEAIKRVDDLKSNEAERQEEVLELIKFFIETNYPVKKYPIETFDLLKEFVF
ncbi:hypothetical protein BY996DRAFT_6613586 [Phakopsora pachyrhizi]|nr:hypothetical protein BY996DRAFT_6613586 [Phakopsora pachyrhizi]